MSSSKYGLCGKISWQWNTQCFQFYYEFSAKNCNNIFWMYEIMERLEGIASLLSHKWSNLWTQLWVLCKQCTECKVHFSLVSGHLLVFHRRCWVVCCLLKVVEADITLHNGLIDINLPIYVHPCCHIVHLFLVGLLSSLRDWLLLPWRQADADC